MFSQSASGWGVMFWSRIMGDRKIDLFKMPEALNINAIIFCSFIRSGLTGCLDKLPLFELREGVFMQERSNTTFSQGSPIFCYENTD